MREKGPKIKHISRNFETGDVTETLSGGDPDTGVTVRHHTEEDGRQVTITERGGKRVEEGTPSEDPEGLRPTSRNQRGTYRGRWGSED